MNIHVIDAALVGPVFLPLGPQRSLLPDSLNSDPLLFINFVLIKPPVNELVFMTLLLLLLGKFLVYD